MLRDDRYGATIDLKDLRTKMGKEPEAQSTLHVEAELGRDMAELKALEFTTRKGVRSWQATGSINHFAKPEWQAKVKGTLESEADCRAGGCGWVEGGHGGSGCEWPQLHDGAGGGAEASAVLAAESSEGDCEAGAPAAA